MTNYFILPDRKRQTSVTNFNRCYIFRKLIDFYRDITMRYLLFHYGNYYIYDYHVLQKLYNRRVKTSDQTKKRIRDLSAKYGIQSKKLLDLLMILKKGEIENNILLQELGLAKTSLNNLKSEIVDWLEPVSHITQLSQEGQKAANEVIKADYLNTDTMWDWLKQTHTYKSAEEVIKRCKELRVAPKRNYDQFTAMVSTTAARAALMNFFDDIEGKRILFLGDDDFTSIATAKFENTEKITIADIDTDILKNIAEAARCEKLDIETVEYDARKALPESLIGRFDIVFTDPPYTPNGIDLFLSRAIEALDRNNKAARIYICYGNSDAAKERFLPIYENIIKSGLMIRWIFDKFNRYIGAELIGSTSSLFICELTLKTKSIITGVYEEYIYTT